MCHCPRSAARGRCFAIRGRLPGGERRSFEGWSASFNVGLGLLVVEHHRCVIVASSEHHRVLTQREGGLRHSGAIRALSISPAGALRAGRSHALPLSALSARSAAGTRKGGPKPPPTATGAQDGRREQGAGLSEGGGLPVTRSGHGSQQATDGRPQRSPARHGRRAARGRGPHGNDTQTGRQSSNWAEPWMAKHD